nr:non-receptor tyrosine-protein kinase TNK1 [Zootoca vivipara]
MAPDDGTDWLLQLLSEIQLEQFYGKIRNELHVTRPGHFDYVKPSDLERIGMGRPGQRRLEEALKRRRPQGQRPMSWVYKMFTGTRILESDEAPSPAQPCPTPRADAEASLKCLISEWDLRIRERLGDGCFGVVHRAEWSTPGGGVKPVAVKSLRSDVSCDPGALIDFLNEVNAMCCLNHPNLLRLHGVVLTQPLKMVKIGETALPPLLRRCAPESLRMGVFTSASDVWMFGVTLWEMFSYCEEPWMGYSGRQIMLKIDREGRRLERPDDCPREIHALAMKCWAHSPEERPRFREIVSLLQELRPKEVKASQDLNEPGWLRLEANDGITVIEGSPDSSTWRGQNRRTLRVGIFPSSVAKPEDEAPPAGTPQISLPIRSSFVHLGHGDIDPERGWGAPDRIEEKKPKARAVNSNPQNRAGGKQLLQLARLSKSLESLSDFSVLRTKPRIPAFKPDPPGVPLHQRRFSDLPAPLPPPAQQLEQRGRKPLSRVPNPALPSWALPKPEGPPPGAREKEQRPPRPPPPKGPLAPAPSGGQRPTLGEIEKKIKEVEDRVHGATTEECHEALRASSWDVQKASQLLKVNQLFHMSSHSREECRWILEKHRWNLAMASRYVLSRGLRT